MLERGQPVWAQSKGTGWRPAVVLRAAPKFTYVQFQNEMRGRGRRKPEQLRPRDPKLNGADKPRPLGADESQGKEVSDSATGS